MALRSESAGAERVEPQRCHGYKKKSTLNGWKPVRREKATEPMKSKKKKRKCNNKEIKYQKRRAVFDRPPLTVIASGTYSRFDFIRQNPFISRKPEAGIEFRQSSEIRRGGERERERERERGGGRVS